MELSTSTISNEISKSGVQEDFSISKDALGHIQIEEPESFSNEQIRKNDLIMDMYKITSDAIHGGMGSVWRVHQQGSNRDLAMKRPQPRFFSEGSQRRKEEFIKECENWINLGLHPNIVACFYVRGIGSVPTIFSEWMDKGSLKDCIRNGALYTGSEEEVQERILDIAIQAARGLQYSHKKGLIHQDVKPGNLLLTKGFTAWDTKVADFGLAKAQSQLTDGGKPASSGYTIQYCPREQADGEPAEEWMDIYAWALTVLEMYCGKRHWETGAEAGRQFRAIFRQCRIPMPRAMRKLIKHCLKKKYTSFEPIEELLLNNYRAVRGREYERKHEEAASDSADALNNQAISYIELGMTESATRCWEEAKKINFSHTESLYNAGLFAWRTGEQTCADLTRQLLGHPYYLQTREGEEAIAALAREAGKTNPDEPLFSDEQTHKADVNSSDGRFQKAYLWKNRVYLITRNPDADNKEGTSKSSEKLLVFDAESGKLLAEDDFAAACRESGKRIFSAALGKDAAVAVLGTSDNCALLYDVEKRKVLQTVSLKETGMYDFAHNYSLTGLQNRFLRRSVSHGMGHAPPTVELYDLSTGIRMEPRDYYDPKSQTRRAVMDGKSYKDWQLISYRADEAPDEPSVKEYIHSVSDGLAAIPVYQDGDSLYWCDPKGKATDEIQAVLASELSDNRGTLRITDGKTLWLRGSEGLMNFDIKSGKCLRSYMIDMWHHDFSIDENGLGVLRVIWGSSLDKEKPQWQYRKLPEIREEDEAGWAFSPLESYLNYKNRIQALKLEFQKFQQALDFRDKQEMCHIYYGVSKNDPHFFGSEAQKVMESKLNALCREKDGYTIEILDIEMKRSGKERNDLLRLYGLDKDSEKERVFGREIFLNEKEEQIFRNQQEKGAKLLDVNEKHGLIAYATELGTLRYAFRLWSMDEQRNLLEIPLELNEYRRIIARFALTEENGVRFLVAPAGLVSPRRDETVPVKAYQYGCSYQPAIPRRKTEVF